MTRQGAERAVTVSALVVFGVYFYRVATEGHSSSGGGLLQLGGVGAPANIGRFITGWGFAYLLLGIITEAAPPLGGSLAILLAAGDVLTNAGQVSADVNHKLGAAQPKGGTIAPPQQRPAPAAVTPSGATGVFGTPAIGGFPTGAVR